MSPGTPAPAVEDAFRRLQPTTLLLIRATKEGCWEEVDSASRSLMDELGGLSPDAASSVELEQFLLIPLKAGLGGDGLGPKPRAAYLLLLERVLRTFRGRLGKELVQALGSLLLGRLSSADAESELGVLRAVDALWARADTALVSVLHAPEALPFVAHQTFQLLKLLERESGSLELRLVVLSSLAGVTGLGEGATAVVATSLAALLPGLSIGLAKLLGEAQLHHRVAVRALTLLRHLLSSVMCDAELAAAGSSGLKTPQWFAETAAKLHGLLRHVAVRLAAHHHFEVRLGLLRLVGSLLSSCRLSLADCVGLGVDVLAAVAVDPSEQLRTAATETTAALLSAKGSEKLRECAQDRLFDVAGRLPTDVRAGSDEKGQASLRQLEGLLRVLGPAGALRFLRLRAQSERLLRGLANCVAFQLHRAPVTADDTCRLCSVPLRFRLKRELGGVMRLLAAWAAEEGGEEILDHLAELLSDSEVEESASLYLTVAFLSAEPLTPDGAALLCDVFVRRLSELAPLDLAVRDSEVRDHAAQESTREAVAAELLLRGLGLAGPRLPRQRLDLVLLEVVYKLLELATSLQPSVAEAAVTCLESLAGAAGLEATVGALAFEYADLLLSGLSLRLRHLRLYPRAPLVLALLYRRSDRRSLLGLGPILPELLAALDREHLETSVLILSALNCLVEAVERLPEAERMWKGEVKEAPPALEEEDEEASPGQAITTPLPPPLVVMVVGVLKRTKHLLNSEHLPLRLLLLDCLRSALGAVAGCDDELLPMIHQNWPPVRARCLGSQLGVAFKALQVVLRMSQLSRSFIYWKLNDELWPELLPKLRAWAADSENTGPVYAHSARFKFQREILSSIGPISERSKIGEANKLLAAQICAEYESSKQPKALVAAARSSIASLNALPEKEEEVIS